MNAQVEASSCMRWEREPTAIGRRVDVMGLGYEDLRAGALPREPAYRAGQLYRWLYQKRAETFAEMTDLPKALRNDLATRAAIGRLRRVARVETSDRSVVRYVFALDDGERIETVLMREEDRTTLCVSSQVGCSQGCVFCATAQVGLRRNMTAGEIVNQLVHVEVEIGRGAVTNVVFMGMGEPLANYKNVVRALRVLTDPHAFGIAAAKVTVSTSGLVPAIERFADEGLRVRLALSLNATTDDVRDRLIPSNRRYGIARVLESCRRWTAAARRELTVEYVLLQDVNDNVEDAHRLSRLLAGLPCKVNLIPFNPVPGTGFWRPSSARVAAFRDVLVSHNCVATVRETRGEEITAACGQLRAQYISTSAVGRDLACGAAGAPS
jgi:23S rRNA (adenine2503-C2)-methyltransferase